MVVGACPFAFSRKDIYSLFVLLESLSFNFPWLSRKEDQVCQIPLQIVDGLLCEMPHTFSMGLASGRAVHRRDVIISGLAETATMFRVILVRPNPRFPGKHLLQQLRSLILTIFSAFFGKELYASQRSIPEHHQARF